MKLGLRFVPKLTLIFVIFAVVLLAAVGLLAFSNGQNALRSATTSELQSTAIEKQAALDAWMSDRLNTVAVLSTDSHIVEDVRALMAAEPGSPAALDVHDRLAKALVDYKQSIGSFTEIMILHPETGEVLVSTDPIAEGKFRENRPFFIEGKQAPYIQNLYFSPTLQAPAMTAAAPILAAPGTGSSIGTTRLLAVLAARLDLNEMDAIIQRRTGLHASDDAFLVSKSHLYVTQPRFVSDPAVLQRGIHTEAIDRCLAENSGSLAAPDYRGIPALIIYTWLPERQLCLIVKLDQAEAFAPIAELGKSIGLFALAALLLAALLAYGLARSLSHPIRQLVRGTAAIAHGDLTHRIQIRSGDEFGLLGNEFNSMAAALLENEKLQRGWAAELEQRVNERTLELALSEERYRVLAETSPEMIFVIDLEDRMQYVNQLAAGQLGKTPDQIIGKPRAELLPPEVFESQSAGIAYVLKTGEATSSEAVAALPAGSIWLETQLVPLRDASGTISGVMGISRDITDRKLAEQNLKKVNADLARSNSELERFAYVASHDLQEPLRMVTSYLQLLVKRYPDRFVGDALDFINYAVDGSNRMKALINDLLVYSRVGTRSKEFKTTDCEALFGQVLQILQPTADETRAEITHDPLPVIWADESQIEQVFQNLVGNAIKFHGAAAPRVHVGVRKENQNWLFSVRDNGIGIDPQYFERIFIIFQRLHNREDYPGTGIGLAISKRIVERHGGRIWIESEQGSGSTFYFTIPMKGDEK